MRRDPSHEDLQFLDWLEENQIPTIPVVTKVDKVSRNQLDRQLKKIVAATGLSAELFTLFSVLSGQGYAALWELICLALEADVGHGV